jgi:hypothetical protein
MGVRKEVLAGFAAAILGMGLLRFALTVSGVPNEITRYASMTVVILAGCVYFGVRRLPTRELFVASYALILPYMAVEMAALGYTWATGRATIFHAPEYSFGMPMALHFWGHLAGGLTWEPLSLLLVMVLVRAITIRLHVPSVTRGILWACIGLLVAVGVAAATARASFPGDLISRVDPGARMTSSLRTRALAVPLAVRASAAGAIA